MAQRREAKAKAEEVVKEKRADDQASPEDVRKAASAATRVTKDTTTTSSAYCRLMGAPVMEAEGEAEALVHAARSCMRVPSSTTLRLCCY